MGQQSKRWDGIRGSVRFVTVGSEQLREKVAGRAFAHVEIEHGFSHGSIRQWALGIRKPTVEFRQRLLEKFGISPGSWDEALSQDVMITEECHAESETRSAGAIALAAIARKFPQAEIGKRIGVVQSVISTWCSGRRSPSDTSSLLLLEEEFGIPRDAWGNRSRRPARLADLLRVPAKDIAKLKKQIKAVSDAKVREALNAAHRTPAHKSLPVPKNGLSPARKWIVSVLDAGLISQEQATAMMQKFE